MKSIVFTLIFVIVGITTSYSQNVLDYFYPMNSTVELIGPFEKRVIETVLRDNFIQCRIHVYSRDMRSYQPSYKYDDSQDFIYTVENNTIIYNEYVEDWFGEIKYKGSNTRLIIPSKNEESRWKGQGNYQYVAKQMQIKTKRGTLSAIGVVCYSGSYIMRIECWCKGWGLSLSVNKNGDLIMRNTTLFDTELVNSIKSTQWDWVKNNDDQIQSEQEDKKQSERVKFANNIISKLKSNANSDKTIDEIISTWGIRIDKGIVYNSSVSQEQGVIGKYVPSSLYLETTELELAKVLCGSRYFSYLVDHERTYHLKLAIEKNGKVRANETWARNRIFSDIDKEMAALFVGSPAELCIWEDLDKSRLRAFPVVTPVSVVFQLNDKTLISNRWRKVKIVEKKGVKTLKGFKNADNQFADIVNAILAQIEAGGYKDDNITVKIWEYNIGTNFIDTLNFKCAEVGFARKYDNNNLSLFFVL